MYILGMFEKPRRIDFKEIMEEQAQSTFLFFSVHFYYYYYLLVKMSRSFYYSS